MVRSPASYPSLSIFTDMYDNVWSRLISIDLYLNVYMFVLYMTYSYPAIMAPFLLIGLRVWGSIILEMTEYVVVMLRAQYSQAKACSSVFV